MSKIVVVGANHAGTAAIKTMLTNYGQENEIVVVIMTVKNRSRHRIEKSFGQFRLQMIDQQTDIKQFGLMPHLHRQAACLEFALQPAFAFAHAQVIKLDALPLPMLLAMPVLGFKTMLGAGRLGAEQTVMPIKPFHHRFGDVMGFRGVKNPGGIRHGVG